MYIKIEVRETKINNNISKLVYLVLCKLSNYKKPLHLKQLKRSLNYINNNISKIAMLSFFQLDVNIHNRTIQHLSVKNKKLSILLKLL